MRSLIVAAALLVSSASASIAACFSGGAPLNLPIPNFGDSGTVWAACIQQSLIQLSTTVVAANVAYTNVDNNWSHEQTSQSSWTFIGATRTLSSSTASAFFGDGSHLQNLPSTSPGGSSGQIQYNNGGSFAGSQLTWDGTRLFAFAGSAGDIFSIRPRGEVSTSELFSNENIHMFSNGVNAGFTVDSFLGITLSATNLVFNGSTSQNGPFVGSSSVTASAFYGDGSHLTGLSAGGDVFLSHNNVMTGFNTFTSSTSFTEVALSSGVFAAVSAPVGISGKGVLYFDTSAQAFMVKENNGTAKPIVDPPGNWTCTLRNGSGTTINSTGASDSVSCSGSEKVLSGGCTVSSYGSTVLTPFGAPTNQGWSCQGATVSGSVTLTSYANCCL